MIDSHEMTHSEYLRLNGTLSQERIEQLVTLQEESGLLAEGIDSAKVHIEEGMTQFPAEDFLEPIKSRLVELQKNLRGRNREELSGIIEALDDLAQTTFYGADYGRNELHKAVQALSGAGPNDDAMKKPRNPK